MSATKELTYEDRPWPDGTWMNEPDRVQWIDDQTGLFCIAKRNTYSGFLCGYVAVPPGHPFHGKDYSDCLREEPCGESFCEHEIDFHISVHGGVTYSAPCQGDPEIGICHVPAPGEPDDVWWFGFDCGHAWDVIPSQLGSVCGDETYRTISYVKHECASMAKQLAEVAA